VGVVGVEEVGEVGEEGHWQQGVRTIGSNPLSIAYKLLCLPFSDAAFPRTFFTKNDGMRRVVG